MGAGSRRPNHGGCSEAASDGLLLFLPESPSQEETMQWDSEEHEQDC